LGAIGNGLTKSWIRRGTGDSEKTVLQRIRLEQGKARGCHVRGRRGVLRARVGRKGERHRRVRVRSRKN